MKVNKKGQEMSVATLVLIVIGIVVLVMLILGFSMGWKNLWGKINVFGGGSNVESVIQSCQIAATSDSQYSYCNEFKKVTIDNKAVYVNCQYPAVDSSLDKKLNCGSTTLALEKCNSMAKDIKGKSECEKLFVNNNKGVWTEAVAPATVGTCAC